MEKRKKTIAHTIYNHMRIYHWRFSILTILQCTYSSINYKTISSLQWDPNRYSKHFSRDRFDVQLFRSFEWFLVNTIMRERSSCIAAIDNKVVSMIYSVVERCEREYLIFNANSLWVWVYPIFLDLIFVRSIVCRFLKPLRFLLFNSKYTQLVTVVSMLLFRYSYFGKNFFEANWICRGATNRL